MEKIDQHFSGVFPAFYACYDEFGRVSPKRVQRMVEHLARKGVKGLYVGGSSGECIYQSVEERKLVLEQVMEVAKNNLVVIAHVACNNTQDSVALACHAQNCGVDAIAAIPPIYFHLPEYAIAAYWNEISAAAPDTDFFIYNIPQLAGTALTKELLQHMLENPKVVGVKNSSLSILDIQSFKMMGGNQFTVFNGPDEQFIAGRMIGADGGIGGTYSVMPELFLKADQAFLAGRNQEALVVQNAINTIIFTMVEAKGNLYAVMKEILRKREGLELGGVRKPLPSLTLGDELIVKQAIRLIDEAIAQFVPAN